MQFYSRVQVDALIANIGLSNYYSRGKADLPFYSRTQVDTKLDSYRTQGAVDLIISTYPTYEQLGLTLLDYYTKSAADAEFYSRAALEQPPQLTNAGVTSLKNLFSTEGTEMMNIRTSRAALS
mgnify:CR=1 FL=1